MTKKRISKYNTLPAHHSPLTTHNSLKKFLHPVSHLSFMIQQPFFSPEIASVSNEFAITPYNAVTGNHDAYFVAAIGSSNGPDRFYIFNSFGKIHVTDVFPERYIQ